MDISYAKAANAYANAMQNKAGMEEDTTDAQGAVAANSFDNVLNNTIDSAVSTLHKADTLGMQAATTGKVDLSDLVTAVANAELTLNTVVAIRDRVISAYQAIIGMAI